MKAIVGLGNPGAKYRGTRHNVGFAVVEEIAGRAGLAFLSAPANALVARWRGPDGAVTLLAKPLTFMNHSGQAVGELVRYYKIDLADLLIVVDEVQLPLGKLRARARGSAGGHNGLKSIIAHLSEDFSRLRVGIGRLPRLKVPGIRTIKMSPEFLKNIIFFSLSNIFVGFFKLLHQRLGSG